MKSRYSAYELAQPDYIIRTTHPDNPDWQEDTTAWRESILAFSCGTEFRRLEILNVVEGETEAFVTFRAVFGGREMVDKSRFLCEEGLWLYESGEFLS